MYIKFMLLETFLLSTKSIIGAIYLFALLIIHTDCITCQDVVRFMIVKCFLSKCNTYKLSAVALAGNSVVRKLHLNMRPCSCS